MYGDTKGKKERVGKAKKMVAKKMHKSFKMTKLHKRYPDFNEGEKMMNGEDGNNRQ